MARIAPRHDTDDRRAPARRQVVVDATLLETAMRLTGRGQSDTLNEALAHLAELAPAAAAPNDFPDQGVAGC
jgi:hypothetical protein